MPTSPTCPKWWLQSWDDSVKDAWGTSQPFLRLVNSCQEHTVEIVETLKGLGMDIEHLVLAEFITKQINPLPQ